MRNKIGVLQQGAREKFNFQWGGKLWFLDPWGPAELKGTVSPLYIDMY
jgi:hypothetical protein